MPRHVLSTHRLAANALISGRDTVLGTHKVRVAEKVDILIEPYEDQAAVPQDQWRDIVLDHPDVQRLLAAAYPGDVQVSAPEAIGRRKRDDAPFVATAFDPNGNHAVLITGTLDKPEQLDAQSMAFRPNPTPEELARATEVLRNDK